MPPRAWWRGGSPARLLETGLFLLVGVLNGCWWGAQAEPSSTRAYPVSEVHQPPKLLYCAEYRPPGRNNIYTSAVQVEFDVSTTGSVMNAEIVEEGKVISSSGSLGDPLTMARSCTFTPAYHWGRPVAVHMAMWFVW